MFSTAHLTSGLALGLGLGLQGWPLALLVGASVLADWDYPLGRLVGVNHRHLLTHSPPVVGLALALAGLVWSGAWWILAGAALHFALDSLDYGVRWNPWRRDVIGLRWLRIAPDADFPTYLRTYFRDWRFAALEGVFLVAALAALAR